MWRLCNASALPHLCRPVRAIVDKKCSFGESDLSSHDPLPGSLHNHDCFVIREIENISKINLRVQ